MKVISEELNLRLHSLFRVPLDNLVNRFEIRLTVTDPYSSVSSEIYAFDYFLISSLSVFSHYPCRDRVVKCVNDLGLIMRCIQIPSDQNFIDVLSRAHFSFSLSIWACLLNGVILSTTSIDIPRLIHDSYPQVHRYFLDPPGKFLQSL